MEQNHWSSIYNGGKSMKDFVRKAVPKVKCGSKDGTAFMVTPNIAITATHVITEYIDQKQPIELLFQASSCSEQLSINAKPLIDNQFNQPVVALKLDMNVCDILPFECINYYFNTSVECFTFGYPPARVNEGTFIQVKVIDDRKDQTQTRDWNLDLRIQDEIKDFKGVSGAPLIYEKYVVGIIIRQTTEGGEATRMAAVSLYLYKQYFETCGISIKETTYTGIYQNFLEGFNNELKDLIHSSLVRTLSYNHYHLGFPIRIKEVSISEEPKKEVYTHLLNIQNKSAVLLAEPGGGKSYLLNMLAKEIMDNPVYGQDRVPIIITAKHWGRSFSSLFQGIYNQIKPYNREITEEIIEEDFYNGKFLLLVDALDEVTTSKDTLIEDLMQKSRVDRVQIIVTCRSNNYHKELYPWFTEFELRKLDNDQIVQYANDELKEEAPKFLNNISGNLEELVLNPLFLYMTVFIVKQSPSKALPKNKAELYSLFTHYLINERPLEKGLLLKITEIEKERILACYATRTFRKEGEQNIFNECIRIDLSGELVEAATKEIMSAGLLVRNGDLLDFYHPSFNEYFFALSLAQSDNNEIITFALTYYNDETYYEVFEYLSGLLRFNEKQAILLDFLEKSNLLLYRKCLESRFDLSRQLINNWTKQFIHDYFEQVRISYLNIINTTFLKIKKTFLPWNQLQNDHDLEQFDIGISGSMDHSELVIYYEFFLIKKGSNQPRVIIKDFSGGITLSQNINGQNVNIPIISFTDGKLMYYDLKRYSLSIDSAREVALKSIKNRLKEILEKRLLIEYEPPMLVFQLIESVLKKVDNNIFSFIKDGKKFKASLYENNLDELVQLFGKQEARLYGQRLKSYGHLRNVEFFQALISICEMKIKNIEPDDYLLPKHDLSLENRTRCKTWELWSDQQLCNLIAQIYDAFQNCYRLMVENLFSTIKAYLPYYNIGPVKYFIKIIKNEDISRGGIVEVKWLPVPFDESTVSEVTIIFERPERNTIDDVIEVKKMLQKLNRRTDNFSYHRSSIIGTYISEKEVVRKMVYEQFMDDFKYILGSF